jgi:tetratricopeptide (TPR) repeat protein
MTMTVLSAFNPHEFSEATVRAVATGREIDLKEILAAIRSNLQSQTIQHLILSAPRGYGKSFMMRHIQIEVQRIAREEGFPLAVVLMPEELPHVKEPETLLRELTRALSGGAAEAAELSWHEDDGAVWETAAKALKATIFQKVGPHGLFVALVENFDLLLRRAFSKEVQASRLRSLLTEQDSRLMLIAASASGAFDRSYDSRLFQAFKEVALEPWSMGDCLAFFDRQRVDAGKPPLDDSARARARSIASFIGGTPRLATLLGDALFDEDVLRAADLLQKLVDELTPYYKERIEALPGRSQKLLDALLRGGEPATQSEIARRVNANSQAAIAGPFNDLVRERIVTGEKAPGSAEILYRVADRVFAHYYRRRVIDHGRTGCPLEALVDLLAEYFSPEEKRSKAAEFAQLGRIEEARLMARLHDVDRGGGKGTRFWILEGLAHYYVPYRLIPLASGTIVDRLRTIGNFIVEGGVDQAYAEIESAFCSVDHLGDRVLLLLARSRLDAYEGIEGGLPAADEAVALAEQLKEKRFEFVSRLAQAWSLNTLSRYNEALESSLRLADQAKSAGLDDYQTISLREASFSLQGLDRDEESVAMAKLAADLAQKVGDVRGEANSLSGMAFGLGRLGRYSESVTVARQAADLAQKAGDVSEEASALRCAAMSLVHLEDHEEALTLARQAADLAQEGGDATEGTIALRYAAISLGRLERYDEAVAVARQAAGLAEKTGDAVQEAAALLDAAISLGRLERYEDALAMAKQSAHLSKRAGKMSEEAIALRNAAFNLGRLERHEQAVVVATQAAELANKIGDPDEEVQSARLLAWNFAKLGRYAAAIDVVAMAAKILDMHPNGNQIEFLTRISEMIGSAATNSFALEPTDLKGLHELLRAAADKLDFDGQRRIYLQSCLEGFIKRAIRDIQNSVMLDAWATTIELHFPKLFISEISRLRDAARYHESGRNRTALARLEPDMARTLETMFPPINSVTAKKQKKARKPSKRKP